MKSSVILRGLIILVGATLMLAPFFPLYAATIARAFNDPFFSEQWYLHKMNVLRAWETTTGSSEVIVAILDAGFDLDHPDLDGVYWRNTDEIPNNKKDDDHNGYDDDVIGWDFVDNDTNPSAIVSVPLNDTVLSHGTVIAGLIGAHVNNNEGIVGINHQISLMPLRILDDQGAGSTRDVREAIVYAVKNGAQIINLSFVSDLPDEPLKKTIAWAVDQGVVIVSAVGNGHRDLSQKPTYPACYDASSERDLVIGVAATDPSDKKASFSNFGDRCTDVSAPGTNIFGSVFHDPSSIITSIAYGSPWEGTSIAAPMVSAAAALMKARYPSLTPEQIRLAIKLSVDPVNETSIEARKQLGAGRMNVARALEAAKIFAQGQGSAMNRKPSSTSKSIVVVEGKGSEPRVRRLDAKGNELASFMAYHQEFKGGVWIAMGDVDGDGVDEIVTGAGAGGGPQVRIFDLSGKVLSQFFAYDPSDRQGIMVAVGDVNADGQEEIVVVSEKGGNGEARVFNQHGQLRGMLRPFGRQSSLLQVAFANADEDEADELLFFLQGQRRPLVRVLKGDGSYVQDISLPETSQNARISAGDFDGDGKDELVVGAGVGRQPFVFVYPLVGQSTQLFNAYHSGYTGGIDLCVGDIDQNGRDEIYTTPLTRGGPHVRMFEKNGVALGGFFAFDETHRFGARCAI